MRIDDLSAFIQAHKLVSGRSCPEFVPSDLGVGCAYFNALQTARRIHSENAGGYIPLYAKSKYGLSRTFFMAHALQRTQTSITTEKTLQSTNTRKSSTTCRARRTVTCTRQITR